jgi:photosystem II stability/assembly factor-like uncharacterized protein
MKKVIYLFILISIISHHADAQWVAQNSGTNQNLYDIEFLNDRTGWAVGNAGVVIKTTNGGADWINVPNPSPMYSPNLWSVLPIDSNIVFVTSGKDLIMKSTNGGLNWLIMNFCASCNSSMPGITFLNKDTGWFLGSYKVLRTFNGGVTLDSFYVPWFENTDIYFKDMNTGVFCGTGRAFKSTDGGENWFDTNVPVLAYHVFMKLGRNGNNLWLAGSGSPVFRSTDFGDTWYNITPGRQIGSYGLHFVNDSTGFIGRSRQNLIKTTDGGFNWQVQQTDTTHNNLITSLSFVNDSIGWYCGTSGKIYKTTTGGQWLTNIRLNSAEVPEAFELQQNYPNPFNNSTEIGFSIKNHGHYRLEVYDLLGKSADIIFDRVIQSGVYSVSYDASHLSSGVYFYRLIADGLYKARKFVIIK